MPWRAENSNFWTVAKKLAHVSSRLPFSQVAEICVTVVSMASIIIPTLRHAASPTKSSHSMIITTMKNGGIVGSSKIMATQNMHKICLCDIGESTACLQWSFAAFHALAVGPCNQTARFLTITLCNAQWPIGYGVGLRIKRSSVRIRPWPLRWVLGQGSLLPLSQGEAFTLASISYLAILVKYILAKKKKIVLHIWVVLFPMFVRLVFILFFEMQPWPFIAHTYTLPFFFFFFSFPPLFHWSKQYQAHLVQPRFRVILLQNLQTRIMKRYRKELYVQVDTGCYLHCTFCIEKTNRG